jgi:hypothetical protein
MAQECRQEMSRAFLCMAYRRLIISASRCWYVGQHSALAIPATVMHNGVCSIVVGEKHQQQRHQREKTHKSENLQSLLINFK